MVALVMTDLLSPNMYALVMMGTPRYLSMFLRSMICSVAVLAATTSEPNVAVSTAACLFKYQSIGVVLMKCNTAVTYFPVTVSCTPSVLCLAHEFARNYFFPCERPILSKPIRLDSIGEDVHFDVYLQCSQKQSWVS